jgi:cystathionine beta-lyase
MFGGHSDILLGSVTVASQAHHLAVRGAASAMGHYASPDDCWLALRGARTMAVRLAHQERAAMEVARWLQARPEVARVLHPALPEDPGHAIWKRDFTGACSLFGVVFHPRYTEAEVFRAVDGLRLFGIGASWGGYESLALPTNAMLVRRVTPLPGGQAVRLAHRSGGGGGSDRRSRPGAGAAAGLTGGAPAPARLPRSKTQIAAT